MVSNSVNELGGIATWTHQIASLFAGCGHRVRLIGIAHPSRPQDLGPERPYTTTTLYATHPGTNWTPNGIKGRLNVRAYRRQAAREAGMHKQAEKLSQLFRDAAPGGMVIVSQVWAMEWVRLADTHGMPVIGMSHESFEASQNSSRLSRVHQHFGPVDRLLVLTQEDADLWIRRQGLNNVGVMPNPTPFYPKQPSPRTAKVVASLGRLSHEKGFDLLLQVWAQVTGRHPGWSLRIYGSGREEQALRHQCTKLGLDDSVQWMGPTADVAGALSDASVFVQSSRAEGFPLSLLEAMASGVPCAAFDCAPGVREIIRDGQDGLLTTPGNTQALARALDRLLRDADLRNRMGDLARENVRRFSAENIMHRWHNLFELLER